MTAHWNGGSGGKGSAPRPFSIAHDEYEKRWDAIFQRDIPKVNEDGEKLLGDALTNQDKEQVEND